MEEVLYGCDVMPSAIHITGSTLSGAQPNGRLRKQSRLYTMPYGRQEGRDVCRLAPWNCCNPLLC